MSDDPLGSTLYGFLSELGPVADRVEVCGGYGLYLRQQELAESGAPTLIPAELWPIARATLDIDVFLSLEVVASPAEMARIRGALERRGFQPRPEAQYHQFVRELPDGGTVRIDLLAADPLILGADPRIRADATRARPWNMKDPILHAHPCVGVVPDAGPASRHRVKVGALTIGVRVPSTLRFLMMKLSAYADAVQAERAGEREKHAVDLYRIVAMTSREEDQRIPDLFAGLAASPAAAFCRTVAAEHFAGESSPGILLLRAPTRAMPVPVAGLEVFTETMATYFGR